MKRKPFKKILYFKDTFLKPFRLQTAVGGSIVWWLVTARMYLFFKVSIKKSQKGFFLKKVSFKKSFFLEINLKKTI